MSGTSEKQNVVLDTCVIFNGLNAFWEYNQHGMRGLELLLENQKARLGNIEKYISQIVPKDMFGKAKGLPFNIAIDKWDELISSKYENLKAKVEDKKALIAGKKVDEDGVEHDYPIDKTTGKKQILPPQRIEKIKQDLVRAQKEFDEFKPIAETFEKLREAYKNLHQQYWAGKIVELYAKGKMNLFVVSTGYDEVLNHVEGCTPKITTNEFKVFSEDKILCALDCCSLISFRSNDVVNIVHGLASLYRTSINDERAMANDQNSLGEYGDSCIMAEANLAGMMLITLNEKDFIIDKAFERGNEKLRKHIGGINEMFPEYTTDALPYSPKEFCEGKYNVPTKKSSAVKFVPQNHRDYSAAMSR